MAQNQNTSKYLAQFTVSVVFYSALVMNMQHMNGMNIWLGCELNFIFRSSFVSLKWKSSMQVYIWQEALNDRKSDSAYSK